MTDRLTDDLFNLPSSSLLFPVFGQHCDEWQNDLHGIFRVQNGGPLKSAALFGRTPRTCLRPALSKYLALVLYLLTLLTALPAMWDSLPSAACDKSLSLDSFDQKLKSHLFGQ